MIEIIEMFRAMVLAEFRRVTRRVPQIFGTDQLNTHTLYPCDTMPHINHSTHSSASAERYLPYIGLRLRNSAMVPNLRNSARNCSMATTALRNSAPSARKILSISVGAVLLLLATLPAFAQTPKDDLVKMNKIYRDLKTYSMQIDMRLYKTETGDAAMASYHGETMRDQDNYKSVMMDRISLMNPSCVLMVDTRQRLILYRERGKDAAAEAPPADLSQLNIDSLISSKSANLSYLVNTATEKRILYKDPQSPYKRLEISLDPATFTMTQILYVFSDAQQKAGQPARVQITYRNMSLNKPLSKALFAESAYLQKKSGQLVPAEKYKNFKIVDEGKQYTD